MTRSTGPDKATRDQVYAIAQGRCERCGTNDDVLQIHHRRPRRAGGDKRPDVNSLPNLRLLCRGCHEHIESHRTEAYADGWLLRADEDPAQIPTQRLDWPLGDAS